MSLSDSPTILDVSLSDSGTVLNVSLPDQTQVRYWTCPRPIRLTYDTGRIPARPDSGTILDVSLPGHRNILNKRAPHLVHPCVLYALEVGKDARYSFFLRRGCRDALKLKGAGPGMHSISVALQPVSRLFGRQQWERNSDKHSKRMIVSWVKFCRLIAEFRC